MNLILKEQQNKWQRKVWGTRKNIMLEKGECHRHRLRLGDCGMSTSFIPRFIMRCVQARSFGKWNSSSCPQIADTKACFVWHPWERGSYLPKSLKLETRNQYPACLALNSYCDFAFTSFTAIIMNLSHSWKKIVKTNINKTYCFMYFV